LAATGGGRFPVGRGTVGVVGAAGFRNRWRRQFRRENTFARFSYFGYRGGAGDSRRSFSEDRTDNDVDLTGVLSLTGRFANHTVAANTLYAHLTQQRVLSKSSFRNFYGYYGNPYEDFEDFGSRETWELSWVERQLVAQQLTSRHDLGKLRIDSRAMVARSSRDAPDARTWGFEDRQYLATYDGQQFPYFRRVPAPEGLLREYSATSERTASFGVDASLAVADPVDRFVGLVLKTGVSGHARDRSSQTLRYNWQASGPFDGGGYYGYYGYYGSSLDNLYDPFETGSSLDFTDRSFERADDLVGRERVIGGYGLADLRIGDRVELRGGLRFESAFAEVRTFAEQSREPEAIFSTYRQRRFCFGKPDCGWFPSASARFEPLDRMRLWVAYGRSTARPHLHQLGSAPYIEPDENESLVGTRDLRPTVLEGVDVAWTWDPSTDAGLRVGGFVRGYADAVERVHRTDDVEDFSGTFVNLGRARVIGLEVGGRARVGRFYGLGDFVLTQNVITVSEILRPRRPLDGQATYTLDLQAGYLRKDHDVGFMLDIVGRRQHRAVSEGRPTVFLNPIPQVALYWNWEAYRSEDTVGGLQVRLANLPDPYWRFFESDDLDVDPRQDRLWREYRRGFDLLVSLNLGVR
ncbi:MAG: TonB-dependent receptor, partial [Myxococcota bacterium]